jgi:hypothetical protein
MKIKIKCYKSQLTFLQITNHSIITRGRRMIKKRTGKCKVLPITCHEGHRVGRGVAIHTRHLYAKWGLVENAMPRPLYPSGKGFGTHCAGGWVGRRNGLSECREWTIFCSTRGSNPETSNPQRIAIPTALSWSDAITTKERINHPYI